MEDSLLIKLQSMGIDAINFADASARQLYAFVEQEAPLLLQEWMQWNFWVSLIFFLIGLTLLIPPMFFYIKIYKYNRSLDYSSRGLPWVIVIIVQFIGLMLSFVHYGWLQILVAPRVWILENIKSLF